MFCVWNIFLDSDYNSNVILFCRECSVILCNDILDFIKNIFFRFDLVIWLLMGRIESVCFDNNENIWVWKMLFIRLNYGISRLFNERIREIWK